MSSDETGALVWLSDWACACRDWLLPPMVVLLHACLSVRWWIRFAAAKLRRLKQPTGLFLRAGAPFKARACRDWLLPPMVALLHACRPVRWWIRFAAATTIKYFRGCRPTGKPRRLKRATGTFLRAGFRIRHLPSAKAKKTFLLECLFALVEGGGFEPPKS